MKAEEPAAFSVTQVSTLRRNSVDGINNISGIYVSFMIMIDVLEINLGSGVFNWSFVFFANTYTKQHGMCEYVLQFATRDAFCNI